MAVSAFDQPFLNLMVKGQGELWFHVAVALEAKFGLLHLEQILGRAVAVNDVTADAAYIALAVDRVFKVCASGLMAVLAFSSTSLGWRVMGRKSGRLRHSPRVPCRGRDRSHR